MSYVNPYVYSKHIPTFDHFMNGTLPVRLSSTMDVNFDRFTPDEAMKWVRHYNSCVALEKRDVGQFKPDYVEYQKLTLASDKAVDSFVVSGDESGELVDFEEYDNFMWELAKAKVGVLTESKGRAVVRQSQNETDVNDVIMTRVEQVNGQQFIEAAVDLENWTGTLKVGEREFGMEYGFDGSQVAQRSLSVVTSVESLAAYAGAEATMNPGVIMHDAAKRMFEDLFPITFIVRSGQSDGGQRFRKLFQSTNVKFTKREDVGLIEGQEDLVARAQIDISSSELHQFESQSVVQINLREVPALEFEGVDEKPRKQYFIEVILKRPNTDRFDSQLKIQGHLREWLSSLWRGEKFVSNLGLEDIFQTNKASRIRLPKAGEVEGQDDIQQRITIEEIFKKAS